MSESKRTKAIPRELLVRVTLSRALLVAAGLLMLCGMTSLITAVILINTPPIAPPTAAPGGAGRTASASGGAVTPERGGSSLPRNADPVTLVPKADLKIRLPWRPGETYECIQGVRGTFTHNGLNEYAFDFLMPVGTIVTAAASGRVVRIKQDSREGGTRPRDFANGNVVILDHGRGLFTQYLHLDYGGVFVREGEIVAAGQPIARSGNTGFSTTPHLHFQVQDATGQSLPTSFLCVPGDGVPVQGQSYVSQNNGRGTSAFAGDSRFPRQAFANSGIVLTDSDMPAHLLASNRVYYMRGYVADVPASRRLSVYLMGATGGKANLWTFADVGEDGFFEVSIDLSALPMRARQWHTGLNQSNCFALAIAPVQPDGSFWSKVSVPVTVR